MAPKIEVHQLRKDFGPFTAVNDISFSVEPGQVLGFLGPNGAGKSTTMKMITGFLPPTAGRVTVCGIDMATRPVTAKRHLGYLPEGAPLYAEMTPASFLDFIGRVRGLSGAQRKRRIETVVEQVQLHEVWRQPIETLSKGYKRRVGLAQAMLHDPEVLVLDEPTDGLDPNQKFEVRQLVQQMARDKAIIISTHILEEVDAVCNRAMIISRGAILADGTPTELLALSAHSGAYVLHVPEEQSESIAATLGDAGAVARVERDAVPGGTCRLTVYPAGNEDLAEVVSGMVHAHGWPVLELYRDSGRLEDVFRRLTIPSDPQGGVE